MRLMLVSFAAAATLAAGLASAEAMPLQPAVDGSAGEIILVSGGCGFGFHRGPYGGCRRNFYRGYGYRRYGSQRYFYHNF